MPPPLSDHSFSSDHSGLASLSPGNSLGHIVIHIRANRRGGGIKHGSRGCAIVCQSVLRMRRSVNQQRARVDHDLAHAAPGSQHARRVCALASRRFLIVTQVAHGDPATGICGGRRVGRNIAEERLGEATWSHLLSKAAALQRCICVYWSS